MPRQAPGESYVECERTGPVMVEAKAHCRQPVLLSRQEAVFAEFAAVALPIGQAGAAIDPYDVLQVVVLLEPLQKRRASKATIRQADWAHARRQRLDDGEQGSLFQLVLALPNWQRIAVIGHLQQRQGPPPTGHRNPQHLIAQAFSTG